MIEILLQNWLEPLLRTTTPILLAAMGGLICERSGVVQLGLEGAMLLGSFFGAWFAHTYQSEWAGLLGAVLAGVLFGIVQAFGVLRLRVDQVVLGMALNFCVAGFTPVLCKLIFGATGTSAEIAREHLFVYGPIAWALLLPFLISYGFRMRRRGLWIQVAGEHPEALSTAGISVERVRFGAILVSCVLAAIGGMTLSVMLSSGFSRGMTAGRGYIALASVIFGQWKPLLTLAAALFFGFVDLLQNRLQGVPIWGEVPLPTQFLQSLPYLLTILVLSGVFKKWIGEVRAPKVLGKILPSIFFVILTLSGCSKLLSSTQSLFKKEDATAAFSQTNSEDRIAVDDRVKIFREALSGFLERQQDQRILFGTLINAATQGASVEGLVRGVLNSKVYSSLEIEKRDRLPLELKEFVQSELELLLKTPLSDSVFAPRERSSVDSLFEAVGVSAISPKTRLKNPLKRKPTLDFANGYILRRVLAEAIYSKSHQIFKDYSKQNLEEFSNWYLEDTIRMNKSYPNVAFGKDPLRASTDRKLHKEWLDRWLEGVDQPAEIFQALDRVVWESIHRKLRVINHYLGVGKNEWN